MTQMIVQNECLGEHDQKAMHLFLLVPKHGKWSLDVVTVDGMDADDVAERVARYIEARAAVVVPEREFDRLKGKKLGTPIEERTAIEEPTATGEGE